MKSTFQAARLNRAPSIMRGENSCLVSVIIPTYNRASYLSEALTTVFAQTHGNTEIIIVDDGSTDNTPSVATQSVAIRFPLHYLRVPHTGLPGLLRNIGIEHSSGAFIAFLDSDDLWEPSKLAKQLLVLDSSQGVFVCHTAERWVRDGTIVSQSGQRHRRSGYLFNDSLRKCIISPSSVMIERTVFDRIGRFREDIEIAEDYELWLRVTARYTVAFVDEDLVVKRGGHSDQLSHKYDQIEIFRIRALQGAVGESWLTEEQRFVVARELSRKCRIYADGCEKRGRLEEAEHFSSMCRLYSDRYGDPT